MLLRKLLLRPCARQKGGIYHSCFSFSSFLETICSSRSANNQTVLLVSTDMEMFVMMGHIDLKCALVLNTNNRTA